MYTSFQDSLWPWVNGILGYPPLDLDLIPVYADLVLT